MGNVSIDSVRRAFKLYLNLIEKSKISKRQGKFEDFEDAEISFITGILKKRQK